MAAIPYVLSAESYYKAFHENLLAWGVAHAPVVADRFVWGKADYQSRHAHVLLSDDRDAAENLAFALPLVLPRRPGPFDRVVIILHGLNESEYRKFFPWACTLASFGWPVILFPIAFLVNRRPHRWMANAETQRCLQERQALSGNAVAYGVRGQEVRPLVFGARRQRHAPQLAAVLAALLGKRVAGYYVEEDAAERGIAAGELLEGLAPVSRAKLATLFSAYDQIHRW